MIEPRDKLIVLADKSEVMQAVYEALGMKCGDWVG